MYVYYFSTWKMYFWVDFLCVFRAKAEKQCRIFRSQCYFFRRFFFCFSWGFNTFNINKNRYGMGGKCVSHVNEAFPETREWKIKSWHQSLMQPFRINMNKMPKLRKTNNFSFFSFSWFDCNDKGTKKIMCRSPLFENKSE